MEILFEVIGELLSGAIEYIEDNKKISKWIRYPILFLYMLVVVGVLVGLLLLGILILQKDIIAGIFIIGIGLLLTFLLIYQIYKKSLINKKKK